MNRRWFPAEEMVTEWKRATGNTDPAATRCDLWKTRKNTEVAQIFPCFMVFSVGFPRFGHPRVSHSVLCGGDANRPPVRDPLAEQASPLSNLDSRAPAGNNPVREKGRREHRPVFG